MGFLETFWAYLLISSPYLMLGLLLSGVVKEFLTTDFIKRNLGGRSPLNIFKATLIGIPLPLCSCAVIPTSVTLKKSGASNGATSAFLIATPESGIDSILMTHALMDLPLTIIRPFAAFVSAVVAGFLQLLFNSSFGEGVETSHSSTCCEPKGGNPPRVFLESVKKILHYGFYQLLKDMSIWLTLGLILGAILMHFVPEDTFLRFSQVQGKIAILVIGIPLYICASATTPIAAALMLKGMSPGTALLLLLLGPATNLSNLMVMQRYIGKKGVIINIISLTAVALTLSFLTDELYAFFQWEPHIRLASHQHGEGAWSSFFTTAVSCLFVLLLIYALWNSLKEQFQKSFINNRL